MVTFRVSSLSHLSIAGIALALVGMTVNIVGQVMCSASDPLDRNYT